MVLFAEADYKLTDLLGVAGSTVGIIIAGGIVLGYLGAKYVALYERFRSLAGELRSNDAGDSRRSGLQKQIATYRRQILFLNNATLCVSSALVVFVITVGVAALSIVFPDIMAFRVVGTLGLVGGLVLILCGLVLEVCELVLCRHTINQELTDFSDIPSTEEALQS